MPALGFQGAPLGIDIRKVVQTGITPIIDTAIAHKDPGYPKIGGGLVRAPVGVLQEGAWSASDRSMPEDRIDRKARTRGIRLPHPQEPYYDSIFLMRVAKALSEEPGVQECAVLMATDANKELAGGAWDPARPTSPAATAERPGDRHRG